MKRFVLILIPLLVSSLACGMTVPTSTPEARTPAPKSAPVPATPTIRKMSICLTAETVWVRVGAGTSYSDVEILKGGDAVEITGNFVISQDMGTWWPVKTVAGNSGFVNTRLVCEVLIDIIGGNK